MKILYNMKREYDIVIVGAGPAGCTFIKCLKNDYRILLIDRQKMPASKICGGLLTEESIDFLDQHNLTIPSYVYSRPKKIKKIYVNLDKGTEKEQGVVYNVDRNRFNHWMFKLIENKVDTAEQTCLKKINRSDKKILIHLYDLKDRKEIKITCSYLIGADGVLSRVRKEMKFPVSNKYLAVQNYATSEPKVDHLYFIFSKAFIDHFIWVMPKGEYTVFGLPFHYEHGQTVDIDKLNTARRIIEKYMKIKIYCGYKNGFLVTIPKSLDELSLGRGNVFLIGESAGWISSRSGDGISFALRSAENCAEAFNSSSKDILDAYIINSKKLKEEFNEKLKSFLKIQQRIKEYKKTLDSCT